MQHSSNPLRQCSRSLCEWPASLGHLQHRVSLPNLQALLSVYDLSTVTSCVQANTSFWCMSSCFVWRLIRCSCLVALPSYMPRARLLPAQHATECDALFTGSMTVTASPPTDVKCRLLPTPSLSAPKVEGSLWLVVQQGECQSSCQLQSCVSRGVNQLLFACLPPCL
jgi:hypothetical protein